MEIKATPTIFLNEYQLPYSYKIEDVQYFLLEEFPNKKALRNYTVLQHCSAAAKAFDAKSYRHKRFLSTLNFKKMQTVKMGLAHIQPKMNRNKCSMLLRVRVVQIATVT